MQVIRRLYLYGMSGIMLAILATGVQTLLQAALDAVGLAGDPAFGVASSREQLSLAGALIGVGLPVWAIHWWLVTRSLRPESEDAGEERDAALRSFYLTFVLAVSLVALLISAVDLVRPILRDVVGAGPDAFYRPDAASSLATLAVAGAVWLLHAWFRRSDMAAGPLGPGSMVWPRVYLYGVQLVSAFILIGAIRSLVEILVDAIDVQPAYGTAWTRELVAGELTTLIVVGAAFVAHAWYNGRLLHDPGWRGDGERPASLRVAYFSIVLVAGTGFVLSDLAGSARAVLLELLGEAGSAGIDVGVRSLAGQVIVPLAAAIPWLLAGLAARRQMLVEAATSGDAARRATIARLDLHLVSLVALAFGAIATGWLLGFAVDAVLGGTRSIGSGWKVELAEMLPLAVLGLALWAWRWWQVVARRAADPAGEAASTIRRFSLLLVLGVSILASVGSVALILYRVFGTILGVAFGENVISALSTPFGALVIAAAVALYHGLLVRADLPARAVQAPSSAPAQPSPVSTPPELAATPPEPAPPLTEAPGVPAGGGARRTLVLVADSPEALDAAVAKLRGSVPEGARLLEP